MSIMVIDSISYHSSSPPLFFKGGISFPENGLKGGSKILFFKGEDTQKGGIKSKGGVQTSLPIYSFLQLKGSIDHV